MDPELLFYHVKATRHVNLFINCFHWQWKSTISIPWTYLFQKMILKNLSDCRIICPLWLMVTRKLWQNILMNWSRNMKNLPKKQEMGPMAKRHNTEWDKSTCCILTTNFPKASEQEIWICNYIAYSKKQHYFSRSIKTTHTGSPCITTSYLNLRILIRTFMNSSRMVASQSNEHQNHFQGSRLISLWSRS